MSMEEEARLTCRLHPNIPLVHTTRPYFTCNLCLQHGISSQYHCKICEYDLHPSCCTLQATLRSCLHPEHPLTLMPKNHHASSSKKCNGCRNALADCEWSYRCENCNFDLHAQCAKFRTKITTLFHMFPLLLLKKSPYPARHLQCDLCDERMPTQGCVYHSTNCKFDVHPTCALLPLAPLCSAHPHRLRLHDYSTYQGKSYVCDVCLEFGKQFGFKCAECNFNIHPKCLIKLFIPDSSAAVEGGAEAEHACATLPKYKNTAYGVRILRRDVNTKRDPAQA